MKIWVRNGWQVLRVVGCCIADFYMKKTTALDKLTSMKEVISKDSNDFLLSDLSDECRAELNNLQFCESEYAVRDVRLNNLLLVA